MVGWTRCSCPAISECTSIPMSSWRERTLPSLVQGWTVDGGGTFTWETRHGGSVRVLITHSVISLRESDKALMTPGSPLECIMRSFSGMGDKYECEPCPQMFAFLNSWLWLADCPVRAPIRGLMQQKWQGERCAMPGVDISQGSVMSLIEVSPVCVARACFGTFQLVGVIL